jgi:putative protease
VKKVELLLPAGSIEKLKYAFAFGADAVYAGVPMFSLRAKENEFNLGFLEEAIEYTRKIGKTIYFTVNIMPRNYKIKSFLEAFRKMNALRPDAFIVSDPGLVMLIRDNFPDAVVHLSVQQNTMNWASAQFWHKQGVERVILSRELSVDEIREICEKNPNLEIETFVHGSVCMSHSGRCLISNYLTQRDANQGLCSQSCRWNWKMYKQEAYYLEEEERKGELFEVLEDESGSYLMSSRDMYGAHFVKDLIDAGVLSLKVEGRNKTAYYAAIVSRAYRMCIDSVLKNKEPDFDLIYKEVSSVFNRGFMEGFFGGDLKNESIQYEKRASFSTHEFVGIPRSLNNNRLEIQVKNRFVLNEELEFCFPDIKDDFKVKIEKIYTSDNEERVEAHGGDKNLFIDIPEKELGKFQDFENTFCMIRKELPK